MKYTLDRLIDKLQELKSIHGGDVTISNDLEISVKEWNTFNNINIIAGPETYFRIRVPSLEPGSPPGPIIKFGMRGYSLANDIVGVEPLQQYDPKFVKLRYVISEDTDQV